MSTFFTFLILGSIFILGILIGMCINNKVEKQNSEYPKDSSNCDELTHVEIAFDTPVEFLKEFEEFLNLKDEELTEYDRGYEMGWLAAEKELKSKYVITPIVSNEDIVTAVQEIDKITTID